MSDEERSKQEAAERLRELQKGLKDGTIKLELGMPGEQLHMPADEPDYTRRIEITTMHEIGIYVRWTQETIGFGELWIRLDENGLLSKETEGMGPEWARRALYAVVDKLIEKAHWDKGVDEEGEE